MTVIGGPRPLGKRSIFEVSSLDGKTPPHDLDAEAAVLSACMLAERQAFSDVSDLLRPDHFYSEAHRQTFEAITTLTAASKPIDVVTVASWLKDQGRLQQVGGMHYLTTILDSAPAIANVRAYAKTVADAWRLRQAVLLCAQFNARAYGEDRPPIDHELASLEAEIMRLHSLGTSQDRSIHVMPLLQSAFERIKKAYAAEGAPPGMLTGFGAIDEHTVGFHRSDLTIIAARPGMGKTALMLALLINVAGTSPLMFGDDGKPWAPLGCAFFSLEMPREQIGMRMIAIDSMVSAQRIRTGHLDDADWSPMTWACQRMAKFPIVVDDTSALGILDLRSKVRRLKTEQARKGIRLSIVFVDYLQLMRGDGTSQRRVEEIGVISRGLKSLAKEEDVAVVAGCQLNRALETRAGSKKPVLSDLRESGDIEQDADNVWAIHRPEVYGERAPEGEEGRAEIILLKQRNGPVGTSVLRYVGRCMRFEPMPGYP